MRTQRYTGEPFAQEVQEALGEHVTVQIAKRSELHTFKVMPKRWIVERRVAEEREAIGNRAASCGIFLIEIPARLMPWRWDEQVSWLLA